MRRLWPVLVLLALSLAPAGCTAPERVGEVTAVAADGDLVLVTVTTPGAPGAAGAVTAWSLDADGEIVGRREPAGAGSTRVEDCAGLDCYRVVAGRLRVEASRDGGRTYDRVWEVSGEVYEQLAIQYRDLGDPAVHLASRSIAVRSAAGGHVVFVANGRDGVLYRDVGRAWRRLGVPRGGAGAYFAAPPRLATDPDTTGIAWQVATAVGGIILLVAGLTAARRRSVRPTRAAGVLALAAGLALTAFLATGMPDVAMMPGAVYAGFIIVAITVGGSAMAVAILTSRQRRGD